MNKIGAALIGCGKVADAHALAYSGLDEARFIGVYDANSERAEAFAQRYRVKVFRELDELLQSPEIQAVSVCSPHTTHPDMVVASAQAGKHVLVEKPMAVDLAGCDRAIAAARQANVRLGVVSQRRFYEPVQRVRQAIDAGKIGRPLLGTVTVMGWRDEPYYRMDPWRGKWSTEGGGVMLTQTTHQLDLFQWFMGPIEELFGYWDNLNHPYVEVEDTAVAVVRFRDGGLGTILVSNSQKPGFYGKIHVHGENGASVGVQTDGGSPFVSGVTTFVDPPYNDVWTVPGEEDLAPSWRAADEQRCREVDIMVHYHRLQIQDFLNSIREGREPAISGEEGRKVVEIFSAIFRSQRDRQPARFPLDAVIGSEEFDGRLRRWMAEKA